MKSFFKKYPKIIIFIVLLILICGGYAGYTIWYNSINNGKQKVYDSLKDNAWIDISEKIGNWDSVSQNEQQVSNKEKIEDFLKVCGDSHYYQAYINKAPDMSDYTTINKDVIGVIFIPNTEINYPILRHPEDDDYYLKHNIDGSKGYPGCIYIELCNKKDFNDAMTVIYGHNMRNKTMFGSLDDYQDEEFLDKHKYIFIYTDAGFKIYQIAGCFDYGKEHLLIHDYVETDEGKWKFTGIKENDQMITFDELKNYDGQGYYKEDVPITKEDKCIALATCDGKGARTIVFAKCVLDIVY